MQLPASAGTGSRLGGGLGNLKGCTPCHFSAPLAPIVCCDDTTSWKRSYDGKDMGEVDASIVTTQMMLEAALGLGTIWVGHFDPQKVRSAFRLPENVIPVAILPMGYPHESSVTSPKHVRHFSHQLFE